MYLSLEPVRWLPTANPSAVPPLPQANTMSSKSSRTPYK